MSARERILDAAVRRIAREGIDDVRIARIATDAGVSPSLVHYHFATRDSLLEEALEHSYERAGDVRIGGAGEQQLAAMVDQCLPAPGALRDDFILWVELWLRAARLPALRPLAAQLYARYHAWFAETVEEGIAAGEFREADVDAVVSRLTGLIDGLGLRVLLEDPAMELARARDEIGAALAAELGVPAAALNAPEARGLP